MKIFRLEKIGTFFNSLRIQLMLYFIIVSMVVLSFASYLTYVNMMGMLKQRNEELISQQFAQTEQNILNQMKEVNRLSSIFLLNEEVQNFLEISEYSLIYENVEMVRNIQKMADDIIGRYNILESIYLFTENKEVIGTSGSSTVTIRKEQPEHLFFSTDMYERVNTTGNQSNWYGGYTGNFFNEAMVMNNKVPSYLITQVTGARITSTPNRNGVLVFNIKEDKLFSLYSTSEDENNEDTYIVDNQGRIVSCRDKKKIGSISELFAMIENAGVEGSITLDENPSRSQLIYYKIEELDWYVLKLIPFEMNSQNAQSLQRTFLFTLLVSICAIFVASYFWLKRITGPLGKLASKMVDVGRGELGLTLKHIPKNELGLVIRRFNEMSTSIAELLKENKKMEEEKRYLEIEALQAQINPHFLYNTLNMIRWMAAVIKANNIVDSLIALGNILKPVFRDSDTMFTLKDEISYMENYVKIMNWRFGNGIKLRLNISDELMSYKIPRFILQPLVENSITHGMKEGEEFVDIIIDIEIFEEGNDLIISVADTGAGIPPEKVQELNRLLSDANTSTLKISGQSNQSIGILNVNKRIRLYCGDNYGIHVESPEEGAKVLLKVSKAL